MIQRVADWPMRLAAHLDAARAAPFAWGRHDCALFAAHGVRAMTGADLGAWFAGRYGDAAGAAAALADFVRQHDPAQDRGGLLAAVTILMRRHGCAEIKLPLAGRGDLVYRALPPSERLGDGAVFAEAIGLVTGAAAAFAAPGGLAFRRVASCGLAWRIG